MPLCAVYEIDRSGIRPNIAVRFQRVKASVISLDKHNRTHQVGASIAALNWAIDLPRLRLMRHHQNRVFGTQRRPRIWLGQVTSIPGTLVMIRYIAGALQERACGGVSREIVLI